METLSVWIPAVLSELLIEGVEIHICERLRFLFGAFFVRENPTLGAWFRKGFTDEQVVKAP